MSTLDNIKEIADFFRKEGHEKLLKKALAVQEEIIKYIIFISWLRILKKNAVMYH